MPKYINISEPVKRPIIEVDGQLVQMKGWVICIGVATKPGGKVLTWEQPITITEEELSQADTNEKVLDLICFKFKHAAKVMNRELEGRMGALTP